ncbi:MAG: AMP-binding protein [Actinomycetota bacterium]|jgi:phenylacetate-CoA ligase
MNGDGTVSRRTFAKTETLTRQELEAFQLRKVRRLIERNWEHNPFYRDLWKRAKVSPDDIQTLEDFRRRIPPIEKRDCLEDQTENPPVGRRLGVPETRLAQIHLTSGTSGVGQEAWGLTQADVELAGTLWLYQYHWMGLEPGNVAFFSMPVAFFANGLATEYASRKFGMVSLNLFGMDRELVFRLMERFQPHYVYGTMAMPAMGGAGNEKPGERLHRLKALSGALMGVETIKKVVEAWGAPVYEMYGCTQASSVVGATCEQGAVVDDQAGMVHFLEGHFIVECLNRETGEPAEPEEDCEIFLTTLDREASPAIRFRIHDKATFLPHSACRCGRPYHGYRVGTVARWDDMMKIKGINIWPAMMDDILMTHPEVREYRGFFEIDRARARDVMRIVVDFKSDVAAERRPFLLESLAADVKAKTFVTPVVEEAPEPLAEFTFKPVRWSDTRK